VHAEKSGTFIENVSTKKAEYKKSLHMCFLCFFYIASGFYISFYEIVRRWRG